MVFSNTSRLKPTIDRLPSYPALPSQFGWIYDPAVDHLLEALPEVDLFILLLWHS